MLSVSAFITCILKTKNQNHNFSGIGTLEPEREYIVEANSRMNIILRIINLIQYTDHGVPGGSFLPLPGALTYEQKY